MRDPEREALNTEEIITEEYDTDQEVDELNLHPDDRDLSRPKHKWPRVIGIVQICSGFLTSILAVLELFYLPIVKNLDENYPVHLGKDNCYGAGLFGGFFMILLGSTAVRAAISKRPSSDKDYLYEMHIFVTISMVVGLIFALTAFIQYYELVFFGPYELCKHWALCCFPCILSRVSYSFIVSCTME
ncbi:hypothetical protein FSP39_019290 [Pinctada imbricata]|uniref:Uncharacterized protein n=1 Tax=Pinctada imbricata TaxID=66713 RepID=A0AA88XN86_PINIB|nr:hypothetical protein FSP39_019290 [Pinctada imbricata]